MLPCIMHVSVLVCIGVGIFVGKMHMLMYACVYKANDVSSVPGFLPILLSQYLSFKCKAHLKCYFG